MNRLKLVLYVGLLNTILIASPAIATPRIYQCQIVDYLENGPVTSDFEYHVGSGNKTITSTDSEVRINYSGKDELLSISLRSLSDIERYARHDDRGTPAWVSLTKIDNDHWAAVSCRL